MGFAVEGGRLDPQNRRSPTRKFCCITEGRTLKLRPAASCLVVHAVLSEAWFGDGRGPKPFDFIGSRATITLCYALAPPGRKSGFRAGFRPDFKATESAFRPAFGQPEAYFICGPEALLHNIG